MSAQEAAEAGREWARQKWNRVPNARRHPLTYGRPGLQRAAASMGIPSGVFLFLGAFDRAAMATWNELQTSTGEPQ